MPALYLCVDCGGSKTSAVICDGSSKILGRALSGPSNFAYLGLENFVSAVRVAVGNALKTCTDPPSVDSVALPPSATPFTAAWLGVSGVDSQSAVDALIPHISALLGIAPGPHLILANDTHLLCAPVRLHRDISTAVAVIGGTGSICVSVKETDGGKLEELGRIGGWGWILGDEGGGFNVGREAVRQVLMAHDIASVTGIPPESILTTRLLEHFQTDDVLELLTLIHLPDPTTPIPGPHSVNTPPHLTQAREKRLSSLAPLVFASAFDDGDPLALKVVSICAGILASEIAILLGEGKRAVKAQDSVVSFGGSLVGVEKYRQLILDDLAKDGHVFRYVTFVDDAAAVGAIGLATSHEANAL